MYPVHTHRSWHNTPSLHLLPCTYVVVLSFPALRDLHLSLVPLISFPNTIINTIQPIPGYLHNISGYSLLSIFKLHSSLPKPAPLLLNSHILTFHFQKPAIPLLSSHSLLCYYNLPTPPAIPRNDICATLILHKSPEKRVKYLIIIQ